MNIMYYLDIIITIYILFFSCAVAYLMFFAVTGIVGKKRYSQTNKDYRFLILIPAHNEEKGIQKTIKSIQGLEKIELSTITVIADNCTDNTAHSAGKMHVNVLKRDDPSNRGKGFALQYALEHSDLSMFDAVLVIDADTEIDSNALTQLTESFASGYGAAQLNNCLKAEQDTPLSQLQLIGNASENNLFYKPRAILRLPVLLRGTGMAIKSEVLQKYPWDSHSVTEDVDYAVNLLIKGVPIDYLSQSSVVSPATSTYEQSYTQKSRWASGTFGMIKNKMFLLIKEGFRQNRFELWELAFSLLLLSRPSLVYGLLPVFIMSIFLPSELSLIFIIWTALLIILIVLYITSGMFFLPDKKQAAKAVFHIPVFAVWFFKVQVSSLFKANRSEWKRTDRK